MSDAARLLRAGDHDEHSKQNDRNCLPFDAGKHHLVLHGELFGQPRFVNICWSQIGERMKATDKCKCHGTSCANGE